MMSSQGNEGIIRYISEKDLREQFWKKYGYRKNILAYQFECPSRHGNMDLVTVEEVADRDKKGTHIEFVSFEFKLDDIRKALSQAAFNAKYCHKNFIVLPENKREILTDRYSGLLKEYRNIGIIVVKHPHYGGTWDMIVKAKAQDDENLTMNQEIIKMCCRKV